MSDKRKFWRDTLDLVVEEVFQILRRGYVWFWNAFFGVSGAIAAVKATIAIWGI